MDRLFGSNALEEVMAIRGLNKDFEDLQCHNEDSLPCQNLRAAMRKLGLTAEKPQPPAVALNKPGVVTPPPLLVPQASADACGTSNGGGVTTPGLFRATAGGAGLSATRPSLRMAALKFWQGRLSASEQPRSS